MKTIKGQLRDQVRYRVYYQLWSRMDSYHMVVFDEMRDLL